MKPALIKERVEKTPDGREWKHLYRCFCGGTFKTVKNFVTRGHTKSCGCLISVGKHGHARKRRTPTYNSWDNMIQRTSNPKRDCYGDYGGRGIKVCERWLKFENFLADMGVRPSELTLDRIDNNGNYEPGNCRWADKLIQANNTRKTNG